MAGIGRATSRATHQPISLSKKVEIIKAVGNSQKYKSSIAGEFGVAKSTVSSIMKNKKTLEVYESSSFAPQQKRLRTAAHSDVDAPSGAEFKCPHLWTYLADESQGVSGFAGTRCICM